MRSFLPGLGLLLLLAPVSAFAAGVSTEILVDTPVASSPFTLSPAPFDENQEFDPRAAPVTAFAGDQHFAVWSDARAPRQRLYGARVRPDGTVLDPVGIVLAETDARPLAIASDGKDFLVVLGEAPNSPATPLRGLRVSSDGNVLDPVPFPITTGLTSDHSAAITFDGTNYLVVWTRGGTGGGIFRARVSPGGLVLDPGGIRTSDTGIEESPSDPFEPEPFEPSEPEGPAVASRGISSLVVWSDGKRIRGKRITPDGVPVDTKALVISPISPSAAPQIEPAIVWTGTHYLLSWIEGVPDGVKYVYNANVVAARIGVSAKPLDSQRILFDDPGSSFLAREHALAFDGTNSTLAWVTGEPGAWSVAGSRVDAMGSAAAEGLPAASGFVSPIRVGMAAGGGQTLLVVEDGSAPVPWPWRVSGLGLGPSGAALGTPFNIASSANPEIAPAVACGGGGCLAVWEDGRNGNVSEQRADIYGARLDASGNVVDSVAIPIATAPGAQGRPAVVFDGKNFLVAFRNSELSEFEPSDFAFVRVSTAGAVLDPAPVPLSLSLQSNVLSPLASDGAGSLYIGHEGGDPAPRVLRVTQDGATSLLAKVPEPGSSPAITYGAGNFFAVWVSTGVPSKIRGVRIAPNGTLIDAKPIDVATGANSLLLPKVAFDGKNYFVAWRDGGLRVARVSLAGQVLDPAGIEVAQPNAGNVIEDPLIAFDGSRIVVTWRERNDLTGREILRGAAVGQDGAPLDTFDLSASTDIGPGHGLAALGNGKSLAFYSRFRPEEPFGALRATARIIDSAAAGGGCSAGGDCATGFCVDGVCCDSACGAGELSDCQACSVAAGAPVDGTCAPLDARPCDDGLSCSEGGLCQAGVCAPGPAELCAASGECFLAGICDPTAEACAGGPVPDGTPCSAGACNGGQCMLIPGEQPTNPGDPGFFPGIPDSSGCDCRAAGEGTTFGGAVALVGLASLGLRRARRARAKR